MKKLLIFKIIFSVLFCQKIFCGCFENKNVRTILLEKTPNFDCFFVAPGSNCAGNLEIHIRNFCENIFYNEKFFPKNSSINLKKIPQNSGAKWTEKFFFEKNSQQIILKFENQKIKKSKNFWKNKKIILPIFLFLIFFFVKFCAKKK